MPGCRFASSEAGLEFLAESGGRFVHTHSLSGGRFTVSSSRRQLPYGQRIGTVHRRLRTIDRRCLYWTQLAPARREVTDW